MWTLSAAVFVVVTAATVSAGISVDFPSDNVTFSAPSNWEGDHETLARLLVQRLNSGGWANGDWDMDNKEAGLRVQRVLSGTSQWGPQRKKGEAAPPQSIVSSGDYNGGGEGNKLGGGGGGGVSETDLYLLGAIEKLAKRVERLEKRLMRTEEVLYYMTEGGGGGGGTAKPQGPFGGGAPCREGFARSGRKCYLFGRRPVDWKAANGECRKAGAVLAELETTEEGSSVLSTVVARTDLRGAEYWTGGLNPGLIWIWSHSGRPVSAPLTSDPSAPQGEGVVGGSKGGRCLKMAFKPSSAVRYAYEGADCGARLRFICEEGGPDGEGAAGNALRRWERERRVMMGGPDDDEERGRE